MPTLSVKLPEETKRRIQLVAQSQGCTVHAVMVTAIETALSESEHRQMLTSAAIRARDQVRASGTVVDGKAFGDYLKARVRGQKPRRPRPVKLTTVIAKSG